MYITNDGIEKLIEWFDKQTLSPNLMCLIVGGGINDGSFFEEIFEKKNALDTISGRHTAIFLFSSEKENLIQNQTVKMIEEVSNNFLVLPTNYTDNIIPSWKKVKIQRITEIDDSLKKVVVRESQNIATDIIEYFNLSVKDIPCILFKHKYWSDIFRIETKSMANVEDFAKLLKKISIESEKLNSKIPSWLHSEINTLFTNRNILNELKLKYDEHLNNTKIMLLSMGMTENEFNNSQLFELHNLPKVFEQVGLNQHKDSSIDKEKEKNYGKYFADKNLISESRKLGKVAGKLIHTKSVVKKLENTINEKGLTEVKELNTHIDDFQSDIEDVCNRYGFRFRMRRKFRPLIGFLNGVVNSSKKAKELTSFQNSITEMIKEANKV